MKSRDFVYWLQGFFELSRPTELNAEQTALIQKHLHLVFEHEIDPSYPDAEKLKEIHNPAQAIEPDENKKSTYPKFELSKSDFKNYHNIRLMC